MEAGTAKVGIYNEHSIAVLSKDSRQVEDGGRLALAGSAGDDGHRSPIGIFTGEQNIGPQDSISLSMRAISSLRHKGSDILGNNPEHRGLQCLLHVIDGLHRCVEVFDEEGQTNAKDQTEDHADGDVDSLLRPDRVGAGKGFIDGLNGRGAAEISVDVLLGDANLNAVANAPGALEFVALDDVRPEPLGVLGILFDGLLEVGLLVFHRCLLGLQSGTHAAEDTLNCRVQLLIELGDLQGPSDDLRMIGAEVGAESGSLTRSEITSRNQSVELAGRIGHYKSVEQSIPL